ncbi:MAG: EAL domain-containing protein, partial [Actinomycetes bacterium]
YQDSWRSWYLGALTAVVVVAPFFLTVTVPRTLKTEELGELVVVIGAVVTVMLWLLSSDSPSVLLAAAFIGPLLGWLGIRFGITAVSAAASAVVYFSALSATQSRGLLAPMSGSISMIIATQTVLVLFFLTIYAAAIVERARIAALMAQRDANDQLQMMFNDSPVPICRISDDAGRPDRILEANDAFASMLAGTARDLVGVPLADLLGPGLGPVIENSPDRTLDRDQATSDRSLERQLIRLDGTPIWVSARMGFVTPDDKSRGGFFMLFAQDITARHQAELQLEHQANHDSLTDLPNRYALLAATQDVLDHDEDGGTNTTLLLCDLDNFKDLNDSCGHSVGDAVLTTVAERLRTLQDEVSIIARSGGDEFVLVLHTDNDTAAFELGTRTRTAISTPIVVGSQSHTIGVSIGIARSGPTSRGVGDLLRRADLALYSAKELGRNRTVAYSDYMEAKLQTQVEMQNQIRLALDENRIECWFQPVVEPQTGQIASAEALVRLRKHDDSILFPDTFIDIAESSGLINQLGDRVLQLALEWLVRQQNWPQQPQVAVNVSVRQLENPDFSEHVLDLLRQFELTPNRLIVEVTERVFISAASTATNTLNELHSSGVRIAIDDFGTGYSSLTALRWMPADIVKVDRSFTANMLSEPDDYAIVAAVIEVARALGRTVVAEGVETSDQAQALVALGCTLLQGYHFGRPQAAEEFTRTIFTPVSTGQVPRSHEHQGRMTP